MFQKRKSKTPFRFAKTSPRQLLKRVATLFAGIFFLWVALHIMPKKDPGISDNSNQSQSILLPAQPAGNSAGLQGFAKDIQIVAGILLIGLVGVGVYLHKKKSKKRPSIKSLQTLSRLQLGANHHIYLVEFGEQALLIGATNNQITLLQNQPLDALTNGPSIQPPKPLSYSFSDPVTSQTPSGDFASLLDLYSTGDTKLN